MATVHENVLAHGPSRMSDVELLATVMGFSGTVVAQHLIDECESRIKAANQNGTAISYLMNCSPDEIEGLASGVGRARAARLIAGLHLGVRATQAPHGLYQATRPEQVYDLVAPHMRYLEHKRFVIVCLNAKNRVIAIGTVTEGSIPSQRWVEAGVDEAALAAACDDCPF